MSQISTDMEFIPYKDITLGQVWQYAEEYCVDHCGQLMVDDACLFFMTENSDQPLSSLVFDSGAGTSCEKIIHHITALVGLDLAGRSMALMSSNSLIAAADTIQSLYTNLITNATLNTAFIINAPNIEIIQMQQHRAASMLKSLYLVMTRNISNMSRSNFREAEILARYLVEASDYFVSARNAIVLSLQSDFNTNKLLLLKEELQEEDRTSLHISQMRKPSVNFSQYPDVMFRNSKINFMLLHMLLQTNLLCMVYEGKMYSGITMNELTQVTSSDMAMLRQQMMGANELMGGAPLKDEARKELLRSYAQYPDTIQTLVLTSPEKNYLKGYIVSDRTKAQREGKTDLVSVLNLSFAAVNTLDTIPEKNRTPDEQFPKVGLPPPVVSPSPEDEAARIAIARALVAQQIADAEKVQREEQALLDAQQEAARAAADAAARAAGSGVALAQVPAQQGPGILSRLAQGAQALNAAAQGVFNSASALTQGAVALGQGVVQGVSQQTIALAQGALSAQSDDDLVRQAQRLNLSPELIASIRQQSQVVPSALVAKAKTLGLSPGFIAQMEAQQSQQLQQVSVKSQAQLQLAKSLKLSPALIAQLESQ